MYRPTHFEENRPEVLHALMQAHPLAQLVTHGADGLDANPCPSSWTPVPARTAPYAPTWPVPTRCGSRPPTQRC